MRYLKPLLITVVIYLLVQGLGLWISAGGHGVEKPMDVRVREEPELQLPIEDPEDPYSSLQIFAYILVSTAILLLFIKLKFEKMIKLFINVAILFGLTITLSSFIGDIAILPALILVLLRLWKSENLLLMNLVLILTIPGIGSVLGTQLGPVPSLILLLILAIYDVIAVFGTKHMVTLAESAKDKIPMMIAIPVEDRHLGLGTGDLAIPLVFSVSLLRDYDLTNSVITTIGGCIGLMALFLYTTRKKDVALPALPPIAAGLLLGFGLSLLIL
jgi:presenilin-like A22 family membrane protease